MSNWGVLISDGKLHFPDFLKIMHNHCRVEKLPDEVLAAFKANDRQHTGTMSSKHLKHLLQGWGERLSSKESKLLRFFKLSVT